MATTEQWRPVEAPTTATAPTDTDQQQLLSPPNAPLRPPPPSIVTIDDGTGQKKVLDLNYLFTNDKLKEESVTTVLKSDPFCIPRVTDNVPEYRPTLNPLSILEAEEKLLPRYFRLDFSEGIPGTSRKSATGENDSSSTSTSNSTPETTMSSSMGGKKASLLSPVDVGPLTARMRTFSASLSSGTTPVGGGKFVGKTSTFMGTLPRQANSEVFTEIPVADRIFQTHHHHQNSSFRPTIGSKNYTTTPSTSTTATWSEESAPSTVATMDTLLPVSLTDAALLTALQESHDDNSSTPLSFGISTPTSTQDERLSSVNSPTLSSLSVAESLTNLLSQTLPDDAFLSTASTSAYDALPTSHAVSAIFDDFRDSLTSSSSSPSSTFLPSNNSASGSNKLRSTHSLTKKPRAKNVFRPCTAPGCTKGARGKSGLCQKHGGGKRCAIPNCPKGAQGSSNLCLFHGGGYRCTVEGCTTGARGTSGLCAKHGGYKRGKEAVVAGNNGIDDSEQQRLAKKQHSPTTAGRACTGDDVDVDVDLLLSSATQQL